MSLATGIDKVRVKLAAKANKFMPRTCSLIPPATVASDGFSGHKPVDGTPITNIPCKVEFVSGGFQVSDGGAVVVKTHRITLPVTSDTIGITRHYKISVASSGLTPAMVFEHPVRQLSDLDPFLVIGASFAEGYAQPAMI